MKGSLGRDDVVIQVEGLCKRYDDLKAVDDVSFEVAHGEVFGILGPNGAGKTTTMECIEGIVTPTSGRTLVLGMDTQRRPKEVKQRIGVQLQASAYFDYLTLKEILDLFARFYGRSVDAMELLSRVALEGRASTTVAKLSGGQRQRFTIAAALVNDPEVVFLDEPTTGLDPQARRNLWEFVRVMNAQGRTIVLTTHYMEEAEFLCDRVAIMDGGKIVALDTPGNLTRALPVPYEIMIVVASGEYDTDALERLAAVKSASAAADGSVRLFSTNASLSVPELMDWATASGVILSHLEVIPASLEDVFLHITGHTLND